MTTTSTKPAFPDGWVAPTSAWPRIPVDQSDGSAYQRVAREAGFAATGLLVSPDGPLRPGVAPVVIADAAIGEALLYLLEFGLIDIDEARLDEFLGRPHPPYREGR